ncbi:MAG: hypothetical protein GC193_03455 [Cryomorphaceae bacterium]|nr:hypothetical protein [Cryomorphaceae bacterium]
MKKGIVLLMMLPLAAGAQIADWYKVDLSKLGYRHNVITFENAENNDVTTWAAKPLSKIKGGSWELSTEIYGKHVFFALNGSFLMDIGTTLFQFKDKERWYKNDTYRLERGELFPVQLAFGTNIGKYFALYAGGQYQYTTFGVKYNNWPNRRDVYMWGNQRGFGGHAILAIGMFNVRYSYLHDWIMGAKTFTGMAYTHDLTIHFGLKQVGVFVKFNHVHRVMNGGYFPDSRSKFNSIDETKDIALLPSEIGQQFTFSAGIFAQGLFSGVTSMGARAISQTEQGLREERNKDKRNRIEWKE